MVDVSMSGGITLHAGSTGGDTSAAAGAGGSSSRGASTNVDQASYISSNPAQNLITVDNLLGNANVMAFLHALSVAEGNVTYNSINGHQAPTSDLTHFPYSSTASSVAGAYQITLANYKALSADLGLYDWSPHTQDAMAALLMLEMAQLPPWLRAISKPRFGMHRKTGTP